MSAAEVTDDAIRDKLKELIKDANLEQTTARSIRKDLEQHFGVPLDERKAFISEELNKLLNEGDNDADEEEDAAPAKKAKKKEKSAPKRKQVDDEEPAAPKRPKVARASVVQSERQLQGLGRAAAPKAKRGVPQKDVLKDPNAPKRPSAAYMFFSKEKSAEIKKDHPKTKFNVLNQQIAKMWNFATAEEKFKFEALADADKERYEKELEAYVPPTEEELMARKEADEQERKQKRKDNSVFSRPVKVSPLLAQLVGSETTRRCDITKKVSEYVKEKNLQDPTNRQFATCDELLKKITGEDRVRIFGIQAFLKEHIFKIEGAGAAGEEEDGEEGAEEGAEEEDR